MRDYSLTVLPPWLLDAYGTAWARANDGVKDALAALLKERVAASMPIRPGAAELAPHAPTGALEALGRDRLMPRAVGEPDAGYAERLADAWEIHADGGTARGALRALRAAGYPEAMLVIRSRRLYRLDSAGELVVTTLPAGSWCFEPEPQPFWSRYAVLFSQPNLPPAWTAGVVRAVGPRQDVVASVETLGTYFIGELEWIDNAGNAPLPDVTLTGGAVPVGLRNATIYARVVEGPPGFSWSWETFPTSSSFGATLLPMLDQPGPAPMLNQLAGNAPTGVQIEWSEETYQPDDFIRFDVEYTPGPVLASSPPTLAATGTPAFTGPVLAEVVTASPTYTFRYTVAGGAWRTVAMNRGTAIPLLLGDGSAAGVSITWPLVTTHYAGASWNWTITDVFPSMPGEFSQEMQLIRALTKEWSNAAAVFDGIYVITNGRALGWPLGTLGGGWVLGGSTVLKYQP
jgi:hypothetical protein